MSSTYARLHITVIDLIKQNGQLPTCLQHQVDTYPILFLDDLKYLADLGLDEKSWIDIYIDGNFKSFRFHGDGSITVVRRKLAHRGAGSRRPEYDTKVRTMRPLWPPKRQRLAEVIEVAQHSPRYQLDW